MPLNYWMVCLRCRSLLMISGDLGKKVIKIEHQRLEKIAEMLMASNDWAKALAVYEDLAKN